MRAIVKAITVVVVSGLCISVATADGASELEEMRRELRDLKEQVRTLREAVSEVAQHTKRSADAWANASSGAEPRNKPPAEEPARARAKAAPPPLPARDATPRKEQAEPKGVLQGKVRVPSGEPIAYVYVENVPGAPVHERVTIDQKDKRFVPSWAVVRSGTTISFPNNDNIYHNVFSLSSGNTFDLGLYNSGSDAKTHTFNAPGAVDVYCNIHPQMAASVLVVPNQLFAKVKPDGTFTIKDVPQGQRKVVAWSPGTKLASQWVDVGEGAAQIELALEPKSRAHKNKSGRAYGSYE
jgi:plastocyanin